MKTWKPTSFEDRLLKAYHDKVGGEVYTEVQIGSSAPYDWPDGSKTRRIDAVKLVNNESEKEGIFNFTPNKKHFKKKVKGSEVELIEIKRSLNRPVIGQVLVGEPMLKRDYEPSDIELTILCSQGDPPLKWVCEKKGINVMISKQKF